MKKSHKCARCEHGRTLYTNEGGRLVACAYILDTGKRRPCPPGAGCTVFAPSAGQKRWRWMGRRLAQ